MSYTPEERASINAEYNKLFDDAMTRHKQEYIENIRYNERCDAERAARWAREEAFEEEKKANRDNPYSVFFVPPPRKSFFQRLFGKS